MKYLTLSCIISLKELIIIYIETKDRNRVKEFFHKIHSKLENIMFSIIQKLPEKFIPNWLMKWLDRYTTKRITELKQQHIKQVWRNMYMKNAFNEISNRQQNSNQTEKAPSEE